MFSSPIGDNYLATYMIRNTISSVRNIVNNYLDKFSASQNYFTKMFLELKSADANSYQEQLIVWDRLR